MPSFTESTLKKHSLEARIYLNNTKIDFTDLSKPNVKYADKIITEVFEKYKKGEIEPLTAYYIGEHMEGEPIHHLMKVSIYPLCDIYHELSNKSEFKIIKLAPTDWQKYKKIRLEMLQQEPKAFNSTYEEESVLPSNYWKEKLSNKNELFVSVKVDDNLVGVMSLSYEENIEPENVAVLHGAYVVKEYRGKGIASQLLEFLVREAKRNPKIEILKLWVKEYQTSAVKLYTKHGFHPVSKAGEHTLVMEKSICLT